MISSMRISTGRSFGNMARIASPLGSMNSRSCCSTTANDAAPPSCQAISPQGVRRFGSPSLPRPLSESNSLPMNTATAASGMVGTSALARIRSTPFHAFALSPFCARCRSPASECDLPPPNCVAMLNTAEVATWMPDRRRTTWDDNSRKLPVTYVRAKNRSGSR